MKKTLGGAATAALLGLGALALSAGSASAYVVCNAAGDCWHTDRHYNYNSDVGAQYHPDDWYFHQDWAHSNDRHYRDYHDGRGYYKNGLWITF
jgi:hypothetical protein